MKQPAENEARKNPVLAFLEKKNIRLSPKLYFVDAMGSMALALFATLLMGTILSTLGKYTGLTVLMDASAFASGATGAMLGVAIASTLGAPPLVLCSAGVVGLAGYSMGAEFMINGAVKMLTAGPAGAFFCALVAVELGKLGLCHGVCLGIEPYRNIAHRL